MTSPIQAGQWVLPSKLNIPTTVEVTSATVGTSTNTAYINNLTTAGVLGTAFTAPPSGNVLILFGARSGHTAAGGNTFTSIEVRTGGTVGSGTVLLSAADTYSVSQQSGVANSDASGGAASKLVTGLTAGSVYNVAQMHKIVTTGTGTFLNRTIQVMGVA